MRPLPPVALHVAEEREACSVPALPSASSAVNLKSSQLAERPAVESALLELPIGPLFTRRFYHANSYKELDKRWAHLFTRSTGGPT